jgi:hypothetical protein
MRFWNRGQTQSVDDDAIRLFLATFPPAVEGARDRRWTNKDTKDLLGSDDATFTAFVAEHAGDSFLDGALRFLPLTGQIGLAPWNGKAGWRSDWPSLPKAIAFASDWRGNLWLFDPGRYESGEHSVAVLELASGDYSVIDLPFRGFLRMLLNSARELLDLGALEAWIAAGGAMPSSEQCLGHRIALVLGGTEAIDNLEMLYLVVWVSLSGQIYEQTKYLPPGTKITGFEVVE